MVRLFLPDSADVAASDLRPSLCVLQHQVGVLHLARRLRSRLHRLSGRAEFDGTHNRESGFRARRRWPDKRDDDHSGILRHIANAGEAVAHHPGHVQRRIRHGTTRRGCYNGQQVAYMAVDILDQSP